MDLLKRDLETRISSRANVQELLTDITLPVPVVASTEGVKADGENLRAGDWDLTRYQRYSPILNNHNWFEPTIGRGEQLRFDEQGSLRADSVFDVQDPFAVLMRGKLIQRMAAVSVGWRGHKEGEKKRNELYEYSVVSMPLDIDAQAAFDGRSSEYAVAIRSMADVETVRAWQLRDNDRDLGDLERAAETNRLLRDATPEEIAAWLEGAPLESLDIIRSTWLRLTEYARELASIEVGETEEAEEIVEEIEEAEAEIEIELSDEVIEEDAPEDENIKRAEAIEYDFSAILDKLDQFAPARS